MASPFSWPVLVPSALRAPAPVNLGVRLHKDAMSNVTLAPALPGDACALAELRVLAMRPSLEAVGRFDPDRARSRFLATFDPAATWHVLDEGQRVGLLVLREEPDGLLLDHLYITPAAQGRAVGTSVLEYVFARARQLDRPVRVGALKGSRSNAFYLRNGFRPTSVGEWDNYYSWYPASAA